MSIQNLDNQQLLDEIEIEITEFTKQETLMDTHVLYTIIGKDKHGEFNTQRRFKDFGALRDIILIRWPGCFIPGIPGKKTSDGYSVQSTIQRKRFLQAFCNKIKNLPHLYYSNEFNSLFLRSKEKDIYKTFQSIEKPTAAEIIQKYQLNFIQLQGKDIDQSLQKKIDEFMERLKRNQSQLKVAKKYIKEVSQSQEQLNKSFDQLINISLPNYETIFISQYAKSQKLDLLFQDDNKKKELNEQYRQNVIFKRAHITILLDYIRQELKDCKAFNQCIKIKNDYDEQRKKLEQKLLELNSELNQLNEGKNGNFIKNLFNKQTPDQQKSHLSVVIASVQNDIENIKNLLDIMLAIIGFIEIDRFMEQKSKHFNLLISKLSEYEKASIDEQITYWQYVQNQTSIMLEQNLLNYQHHTMGIQKNEQQHQILNEENDNINLSQENQEQLDNKQNTIDSDQNNEQQEVNQDNQNEFQDQQIEQDEEINSDNLNEEQQTNNVEQY